MASGHDTLMLTSRVGSSSLSGGSGEVLTRGVPEGDAPTVRLASFTGQ